MPLDFPECGGTPWWNKASLWLLDNRKKRKKLHIKLRKGLVLITTPKGRRD